MLSSSFRKASARSSLWRSIRTISTLQSNPHIYIFPNPSSPSTSYILSLLPTDPPTPTLAIGTTTSIPPTPNSLTENPQFLSILESVLEKFAHLDPGVHAQASAFASTSGSALGSGGMFFPQQNKRRGGREGVSSKSGDGAGGASSQGGAGGGGRGGWVHLSDSRAPPDYGRIAWPEDIFGSLEVDARGQFVGEYGGWQPSGTYRVVTREGILGLSDFLRGKLVERLRDKEEELKR